jgi:hypothetical protein
LRAAPEVHFEQGVLAVEAPDAHVDVGEGQAHAVGFFGLDGRLAAPHERIALRMEPELGVGPGAPVASCESERLFALPGHDLGDDTGWHAVC